VAAAVAAKEQRNFRARNPRGRDLFRMRAVLSTGSIARFAFTSDSHLPPRCNRLKRNLHPTEAA
ncbi:MAG TPA: hypothetical protein VM866_09035, partial [Pyrinomonadaceae bacterium]|nr:hypothetical protein [Pyrinomonadaceae bacterium]